MQRTRRGSSLRVLVTLSALCAIGIILGKFLAFNITEFMRFSLENITIIFSGIIFGPLYGAVVGAVQDIVGCLAVGYTINPIITLGSAAIGAVSGLIFRLAKNAALSESIFLSSYRSHLRLCLDKINRPRAVLCTSLCCIALWKTYSLEEIK